MSLVSDWSVFYVYNCRHTNPPKNKYTVIFTVPDGFLGFLINSEINPFIRNKSYLMACIADIKRSTNGFLHHDSYVDCRQMFVFDDGELIHHVGQVCQATKTNIIKAVIACPVLELKYKNMILKRYGNH